MNGPANGGMSAGYPFAYVRAAADAGAAAAQAALDRQAVGSFRSRSVT